MDKRSLTKALSIAALVGLSFCGTGTYAQGVDDISFPNEERLGGVLTRKGIPTGFAAELPTPTLDVKHAQDPTTYPNGSAYYYSAGTETNYDVKVTDGTSSAYGILELKDDSKFDWSEHLDSAPTGYTWADAIAAGSNVEIEDDTITGAIRMFMPHNGSAPTAWNRWYTYTYTKPSDYTITQTGLNDNVTVDNVNKKVFTCITSSSDGGAIYNTQNLSTVDIISDFIGNSVFRSSGSNGGAIKNNGTISSITGNFINNFTRTTSGYAQGGAINNSGGTIGSITGDFIHNFGIGKDLNGGAIDNTGTIVSITGDFINNFARSYNSDGVGGGD